MRKIIASLTLLMLLFLPVGSFSQVANVEVDRSKMSKNHQQVYDASLALYGTLKDETHFLCTATVVTKRAAAKRGTDEYLLLTAGHCVTGGDLPDGLSFGVRDDIVADNSHPVLTPVTVQKAENGQKYDFAVLYMESEKSYPVIPIDTENIPQLEDKVYDVNFSLGIGKQVALGTVATNVLPNQGSGDNCDICKGRYMVHIFAAGGASGSAIVSEKTNKIVGIGEFGFPGTTTGLGCETMKAFAEWLTLPAPSVSPKALGPQNGRKIWHR